MIPVRTKILLIEDNAGDARLIQHMLAQARGMVYEVDWVDSLTAGIAHLKAQTPDVVLLDLGLPESQGLDTLQRMLSQVTSVPTVVVLSGLRDEDVAVQAVHSGAQDYLVKGQVDAPLLIRSIRYAIERSQAREALRHAHDELGLRVAERTAELARTVDALHAEITEREQTEVLLRMREQEFRTLAENLPDMVIRYDRDCRRFYVNPAFVRETGIAASEALHKFPDAQWQRTLPVEEYRVLLQQVMQSGVGAEILLHGPGPDGQLAYHAFHIVAERSEDGQVSGALAIGRNITALKETERQLQESQQLLRQLAARAEAAREVERKVLTREIHDEMGQYLSALRLGVALIGIQFGADNPVLEEKTRRLVDLVDSIIKVVRNVVASLRPAALDMGIVLALEWLVDQFIERSEMPCLLSVDGDISLDDKRATELFRIVQESLTNISRHAQASEVQIVLRRSVSQYLLEVRDNGVGFSPGECAAESFGLVGIRERALALGGAADIASLSGRGTRVKVQFPVISAQPEP